MKKTILNPQGFAAITSRINLLKANSQRQWGTMEVNEMLWHCRAQLVLALGEKESRLLHGALSKWPFNWLAIHVVKWQKNMRTARELNAKKAENMSADFETERTILLDYLEKIKQAQTFSPHPLLGNLNRKDWGYLMYKHLDYHLVQFGV